MSFLLTDRGYAGCETQRVRRAFRVVLVCACVALSVLPACRKAKNDAPQQLTTSRPASSRIVCFAPSSTEIIAALGCMDRLVGVGDFCEYPDEVKCLPRVGGLFDPNLELIMELAPDLVVVRGGNRSVHQLCADRGIDIYNDPSERLEDVYVAIDELGERLSRETAARELNARMRAELALVQDAVRDARRPRVLFVVGRRTANTPAGVTTVGPGTFVDDLIRIAGGANVFGDVDADYPDVSLEAIVSAAPEVIIEARPEEESSEELSSRVRETWSKLQSLPAVAAGRIYVITDDNVLIPSPRMTLTARRLAELLHPEVEFD